MKLDTPILSLDHGMYCRPGIEPWICSDFVRYYFGITPAKISLTISRRPSKDSVPVDIWINGFLRWVPVERIVSAGWYGGGTLCRGINRFVQRHLNPTTYKKRFHVSVWIYD